MNIIFYVLQKTIILIDIITLIKNCQYRNRGKHIIFNVKIIYSIFKLGYTDLTETMLNFIYTKDNFKVNLSFRDTILKLYDGIIRQSVTGERIYSK